MAAEQSGALALKVLSENGVDCLPYILKTLHSRDIGRLCLWPQNLPRH